MENSTIGEPKSCSTRENYVAMYRDILNNKFCPRTVIEYIAKGELRLGNQVLVATTDVIDFSYWKFQLLKRIEVIKIRDKDSFGYIYLCRRIDIYEDAPLHSKLEKPDHLYIMIDISTKFDNQKVFSRFALDGQTNDARLLDTYNDFGKFFNRQSLELKKSSDDERSVKQITESLSVPRGFDYNKHYNEQQELIKSPSSTTSVNSSKPKRKFVLKKK